MAQFEMFVQVGFTVTVKAKSRDAAIKKFRDRVLNQHSIGLSDLQDDADIEWGLGETDQDIDYESLRKVT